MVFLNFLFFLYFLDAQLRITGTETAETIEELDEDELEVIRNFVRVAHALQVLKRGLGAIFNF